MPHCGSSESRIPNPQSTTPRAYATQHPPQARTAGRAPRGTRTSARRARRCSATPKRLREVSREHSHLTPLTEALRAWDEAGSALESARAMLRDPELKELAQEEISALEAERTALEGDLNLLLIPKDPRDEGNLFLEIRAGTGGDEAALFAGDLCACTRATPRARAGRSRSSPPAPASTAATRKSSRASGRRRVLAPEATRSAAIACSACRQPSRRAASTPRPRPWRSCPSRTRSTDRDQPGRPQDRHVPRVRRRRPARQQDRLGDPHHPPAERHRGQVPGRAQPAQEPRARAVAAEGAPARRARRPSRPRRRPSRASCRSAPATAASASAPTTSRRTASPTTAST